MVTWPSLSFAGSAVLHQMTAKWLPGGASFGTLMMRGSVFPSPGASETGRRGAIHEERPPSRVKYLLLPSSSVNSSYEGKNMAAFAVSFFTYAVPRSVSPGSEENSCFAGPTVTACALSKGAAPDGGGSSWKGT